MIHLEKGKGENMQENNRIIYVEKRPLTTERDFAEMREYIRKQGEKAKNDPSYRNYLLSSTGMYDTEGNPKKEFL